MKRNQLQLLIVCFILVMVGCNNDDQLFQQVAQNELNSGLSPSLKQVNNGATQISGVGYFAEATDCDHFAQGADFALLLTGDLEGCLHVFVESFDCSPSGTYREQGNELFIGTYNGSAGSFRTSYKFEAKYEGCADDGSFLGSEIFGRCQHPIVKGSGEGVFEGVNGRIDFKDNVETGELPYRGHLRY